MTKVFEGPVYLEPIEHVYIHRETGEKFTSVTKVISSLVNVFDADAVAEAIAKQPISRQKPKYHGMTKQQILDYWIFLNDEANENGTRIHELIEDYLHKDKMIFTDDPLEKTVLDAYDALMVDEGTCVWPERIMFSQEHKLAGTADLKIDINDKYFDIGDWKGLPIDTPIYTVSGWTTMGELSKDDMVYDKNGDPTNILHLSEINIKRCYEITFDNGETIISDFEHRWLITLNDEEVVMTTEEISKHIAGDVYGTPKVEMCEPLNNPRKELPIDPYVLGVWVGTQLGFGETTIDNYIAGKIERTGDYRVENKVINGDYKNIITSNVGVEQSVLGDTTEIINTVDIQDKINKLKLNSVVELIDLYLQGSIAQRTSLMEGVIDILGQYNNNYCTYNITTIKGWSTEPLIKLISSLGIKTRLTSVVIDENGVDLNGTNIEILQIMSTGTINPKSRINNYKEIISVKEVHSVPTRCIEVGSKTSTFLYGHTFSVTHNTNRVFNFFDEFGFKTMKKPLDHLQDCHYSTYSVQLSVYAYMYELETGKKCRQIWIGYWDRQTQTIIKIPILYLKSEAKKVLDLHKYNTLFAI